MKKAKVVVSTIKGIRTGGKHKHITPENRLKIQELLDLGFNYRDIIRVINKSIGALSNEIRRNGGRDNYDPEKAQKRAYKEQYNKKKSCLLVVTGNYQQEIEVSLKKGWSPAQICHSKKITEPDFPSTKAIYKYIAFHRLEQYLFHGEKNRKKRTNREYAKGKKDTDKKYIDKRPEEITIYDHEMDFIVSKCSKWVLLVLVNRLSKKVKIYRIPNRKKTTINRLISLYCQFYSVKTITTDNDIAFNHWKEIEIQNNITIYFTNPYHSWEKGLVENCNKWIRKYIPKKKDIQFVTNSDIKKSEYFINERPKETLGWVTASEFEKKVCVELKNTTKVV